MRKSLIFSIANRFGRTYSGSCVFQFVEFLNQVYCWDANSFVCIMFDLLRVIVWIMDREFSIKLVVCLDRAMQSFN
jgi:hypothetical protein